MKSTINKHRLSSFVSPIKYDLHIVPNMTDFTFTGNEKINIDITKPTKELVLHSVDLQIVSAVLTLGNTKIKPKRIVYNKKLETVKFIFSKSISGKGILDFNFNGQILDGLQGFYRSKYTHDKQEKYLATTQLEATDARRFFPCFDEPAHKAIFKVSVTVPKHIQVISNTIESKVLAHHDAGLKIVHFEDTPKMSTYLLALIIGELEHVKTKSKNGVQIRIHTTHGKKHQTQFALDVTKRALDFLEDYFGIPYPLPVLDLIAIPDFAAGAMENWGAITFRETALLVDEQHTTFIGRQRVAEVIAHELVHQWFGNLVTMEWWTHLWLNESFATYMAYLTVDKLFPEWNFWTKFVLQEQSIALSKDALHTSQPIEVEVKLPSEISESFDPAIVYAKGASVIRMLSGYIGEEDFRDGLSQYLNKHSYKNTESIHLWDAFEKASGKPVRKFMKTWTQVVGYPVVDADVLTRNHKHYLITSQSQFNQLEKNPSKQLWSIPLLPISSDNTVSNITLDKQSNQFEIPLDSDIIKLNSSEEGFYVVNYSPAMLSKLLPQIKNKQLSAIERLAIVRNTLLLAKSGQVPTDLFLEILNYLEDETSFIVWSEVSTGLNQIAQMVHGTKAQNLLEDFQKNLFGKLLTRKDLGLKPKVKESYNNKTLRALAFLESGLAGFKPTITEARRLFKLKVVGKKIDADLRLPVFSIVVKWGSTSELNKLIQIAEQSQLAQEQQQALVAMTYFTDPKIQPKVLEYFFSEKVRDQNRDSALALALNTSSLKTIAWKQVQVNWLILEKKYGASKMLGRIISGASSFNSQKELDSFIKFTKTHKLNSAKQTTAQTIEKIQIKVAWKDRDLGLITRYLATKKKAK